MFLPLAALSACDRQIWPRPPSCLDALGSADLYAAAEAERHEGMRESCTETTAKRSEAERPSGGGGGGVGRRGFHVRGIRSEMCRADTVEDRG